MNCGTGRTSVLDPELLWLWCGPTAVAPIGPLAWKPPCAVGAALKMKKKSNKYVLINNYLKCQWT